MEAVGYVERKDDEDIRGMYLDGKVIGRGYLMKEYGFRSSRRFMAFSSIGYATYHHVLQVMIAQANSMKPGGEII